MCVFQWVFSVCFFGIFFFLLNYAVKLYLTSNCNSNCHQQSREELLKKSPRHMCNWRPEYQHATAACDNVAMLHNKNNHYTNVITSTDMFWHNTTDFGSPTIQTTNTRHNVTDLNIINTEINYIYDTSIFKCCHNIWLNQRMTRCSSFSFVLNICKQLSTQGASATHVQK